MKNFLIKVAFSFVLFFSCVGHAHAQLVSGTSENGSITTPGGSSSYTFSASAGEGVLLYGEASYSVRIRIYKQDSSLWTSKVNRAGGTIPVSGTYTVVISSDSSSATGPFRLDYVRGGSSVSNGTLNSGQTFNGDLQLNGLESFQITGNAGEGIIIYGKGDSYTTSIDVYKPDGSFWTGANDRVRATLPTTGTYTVVISGYSSSNSGPYYVNYVRGSDGVSNGEIGSGQTYFGSLPVNGFDSFSFEGIAGQGFRLAAEGDTYYSDIYVYKPDGTLWGGSGSDRFTQTFPTTGTYTVVVTGYAVSNSGPYRLEYVRGAGNVSGGTLVSGFPRPGVYQINDLESYKVYGIASNSLGVVINPSFSKRTYLYKPDGSYWTYTSYNSFNVTLPDTGYYTLVIQSTNSSSGPYDITATTSQPAPASSTSDKVGAETMSCPVRVGTTTPNPIDFAVGFKKQTEVDYNTGGLVFSRIYRSDSTWTDNTIGALWRHNYARTLDVTGSTAEIIDGTGAKTTYTLSGSDWIPDDPDTAATFETVGSDYVYTLPDNTVEKYNSSELLTRIEYLGGGALNLTYNGSDQLISVANENNRQLSFTYSSGRVATVTTPDGAFTYAYDGNGNLETVTRPDTKVREYHYENGSYVNALTGITDEEGIRFATYAYDGSGKAITAEHAGSTDDYTVTYNVDGTSTVTNPLGKDTTYHFANILGVRKVIQVDGEASTNCVASNRYYNYDEKGRMIGKTDWEGNVTRLEYDDRNNITRVIEAENTETPRIKTITYDATFNLPETIVQDNLQTDYDYDTYGRVTSMTLTDTDTSETRITTYTYHSNTTDGSGNTILGRLAEVNGPRTDVADVTEYDYDGNLNLTKITNALGQETDITARDSAGRPTTIEDENDVETDLVYDSNGWLTSATRAPGTALEAVTTYDYDDNGNLVEITLPNGATLTYTYDNAQRLTGVEDALGNTITYTLDAAGNITQEQIKDSGANLKYTHTQAFDELSRMIESIGAATQTSTFAYDKNGNVTTFTDANTNETDYAYDALQRLTETTDALSGVSALEYNSFDDVTAAEDQRSNTTTYTYNAFGDVTGETSPDRGTIAYTVDKAGNITSRTDARSVVTNYTWDALNRLTEIEYPTDSSLDATLTYDLTSGCGTAGIGRLCSVADASGTTTYEYNALGHLTEVNETRGALGFTTAYTYDLAGNITGITLPSGRDITYTRNANGQVSGVTADVAGSPVNLASSVTYLPFGPLNALTYGNSLTFSATYDQDYNPTNRTVSGGIYNHTYDTDDNGNIIQIGSTDYAYDALNRLDEEDSGSAVTYTYDATSNRLTKVNGGTVTTTVPSNSNKISAVGSDSYTYDAAGNITGDGTNTYTWNNAGQLAEVLVSSTPVGTYTYDSQNRRTKKVAGTTTHYVYGLNGLLYGEYDNAGDLIREYVYLNDAPLAQVDAGAPETVIYLHPDHLGTPRFATNTGGTQVWAWAGDAFGVGAPSGSATVNIRMPGQYVDAESGLFYNWNRYYNPAIGRYISSDPIGIEGGLNTFLYAAASPLMYMDSNGLEGTIPSAPPENIPGGPWSPAGSGQQPGTFYGPPQEKGARSICRWVPSEAEGGTPGSSGYWKTKEPGQRGWSRFSQSGEAISPEEAHPNPIAPVIRPRIGPPVPLLISPCTTMPQLCDTGSAI